MDIKYVSHIYLSGVVHNFVNVCKSIGNAGSIGVLFVLQRMGFIPVNISLIILSIVLNDNVYDQQSYCSILSYSSIRS